MAQQLNLSACSSHCPFNAERQAVIGLTRLRVKPESIATEADALIPLSHLSCIKENQRVSLHRYIVILGEHKYTNQLAYKLLYLKMLSILMEKLTLISSVFRCLTLTLTALTFLAIYASADVVNFFLLNFFQFFSGASIFFRGGSCIGAAKLQHPQNKPAKNS